MHNCLHSVRENNSFCLIEINRLYTFVLGKLFVLILLVEFMQQQPFAIVPNN